jgi:hypothetical protein
MAEVVFPRHLWSQVWCGVVCAGCLLASGCGGSSGTLPTTPSEAPIAVQAGTFALRITSGAIYPSPPGPTVVCLAVGVPEESLPTTLAILVAVESSGTQIVGRNADGTLVFSLIQSVNDVSGSIGGFATATDGTSTLNADGPSGDVQLSGRVLSTTSLSGSTGDGLTFSRGTASYGCSINRWSLTRQ